MSLSLEIFFVKTTYNNILLQSHYFGHYKVVFRLVSKHQDHTSQDHFCSVMEEFPVWNSEPINPRWWVEQLPLSVKRWQSSPQSSATLMIAHSSWWRVEEGVVVWVVMSLVREVIPILTWTFFSQHLGLFSTYGYWIGSHNLICLLLDPSKIIGQWYFITH